MDELKPEQRELTAEVVLPPHKQRGWVLELKMPMAAGEAAGYEYTADAPLTFNIHSHHGKDVTHHIHLGAATGAGTFEAKEAYDYYAMWENTSERPLRLRYRIWRR